MPLLILRMSLASFSLSSVSDVPVNTGWSVRLCTEALCIFEPAMTLEEDIKDRAVVLLV